MRTVLTWVVVVLLCCTSPNQATERATTKGHAYVAARAQAPVQDGGTDPRLVEAQAVYEEATKLKDAGKHAEAIPKAELALSLWEAALGSKHTEVANCLNLLGNLHRVKGDYALAEPSLQRALSLREELLGKAHPDVAVSLNNLGVLYMEQGQYDRAEPLYKRALTIREVALGQQHPLVASSINNLANLYADQGLYDRAEPLLQRALSLKEASLGKAHPDVAHSLSDLGILYYDRGLYELAVARYEQALEILEARYGKAHPEVADVLNNLANVLQVQGLYDRAESLHVRVLGIRETTVGKTHSLVAMSLTNLATLYKNRGLYSRAEPLYERAIAIREATFGREHPHVAQTITGLANLYADQGQYDRAKLLHERALAIREATFGKMHPYVAHSLGNLGQIYRDQGMADRAEPLYKRANEILEAALGKAHPDVALSLEDLAVLYTEQGLYGQAESLQERALSIYEAVLGKGHPHVATALHNLASIHGERGRYDRAEPLHERAIAMGEATLGQAHPGLAPMLNEFALLRLRQRRTSDAVPLLKRAMAISEGRLRKEALDFSEVRLARFIQFLQKDEQRLYSAVRTHPGNPDIRSLALSAALLFKGRSVEEAANLSRAILRRLDPQDHDDFERLRGLRTQFAKLSLDGPGRLAPAEYQQRLKRLVDEGDSLEAAMAKRSAPLRALTILPPPDEIIKRVASGLPQDGVLVQYVAYTDHPLVPKPGLPRSRLPAQLRYLAMVLFPDGRTGIVDLGPAAEIDTAASRLRDALASKAADVQGPSQKLYQLAFKPLRPLLGKARRLFLSPDGQLALVPFAALHDGGHFLANTLDFTYLTSGRDLLPRPEDVADSASVVVLADPDYGTPSSVAHGEGALAAAERSYAVERFFARTRAGISEQRWAPLLGTRQEAKALKQLLPQAQLFLGANASKEQLLRLRAPGILHVATHGFFLEDSTTIASGARGVSEAGPVGGSIPRAPDPLLRSGLVLSGAATSADLSNSLVTALELAGLDLWGTQLVVLSACDTGRGDIRRGQGVYGLRRSFIVAGAETLVVSLWKVDDQVTSSLMESYYRNLLAGQGRVAALRQAMLALRKEHPHPHYWAPFIGIGRDAPLRQLAPTGQ